MTEEKIQDFRERTKSQLKSYLKASHIETDEDTTVCPICGDLAGLMKDDTWLCMTCRKTGDLLDYVLHSHPRMTSGEAVRHIQRTLGEQVTELEAVNANELMDMEFQPTGWLIEKLLGKGVYILAGASKIGKSWLALKLCLCATRGVDLWGYKTKHCKALYCCLEDTKKRIRKRYDALVKAAEELQDTAPAGWLDFRFQCPKLDNGLVEELEQYVGDNPECKLIVIDTLLMITPRMNDSPYANDYNNIVALKKLADKYEIAIVLIHHTRKLKAADPFDEILGTTGLNGAADAMMILSRKARPRPLPPSEPSPIRAKCA